jgi:hypothetical protein
LIVDVPIEVIEVRPRVGVTREGISFAMGHDLRARFDASDVLVIINPTRVAALYAVQWSFEAEVPPVSLVVQRRQMGVVDGRGVKTGVRAFDKLFKLECDPPQIAARLLDDVVAKRLAADGNCMLDDIVAIGHDRPGVPGFTTHFRAAPRAAAVAESFLITLELRRRIFGLDEG